MFALHVIQAQEGDCLLLQSGRSFVLIDGGPPGAYDTHLRPTLDALSVSRLNLVVLSHVDSDHVVGLIDLVSAKTVLPIGGLWHNTFSMQVGDRIERRVVEILARKPARSIAQGHELTALLCDVPLNQGFAGGLVSVESAGQPYPLGRVEIRVVGPGARALTALKDDWSKWLARASRNTSSRAKARPDVSVTNRSSIVLLATDGRRSILLTGDSRWDEILGGLQSAGELDEHGHIHVDVLKVQHHGSRRNANQEFFHAVTSNTYVVSANGRYANPDLDTLLWIVDSAAGRQIELIVTNAPTQVTGLLKIRPPSKHGYSLKTIPEGRHFLTVKP